MANELAELKALREHVEFITEQAAAKGFTQAKDTKLRLSQADKLIAAGEKRETKAWRTEAIDMAALLRAEAGQVAR